MNSPDYIVYQGRKYLFVKDHRGSINLVVDAVSGEIKQRMVYSEFGEVTEDTNPGFQPFGFAGGPYDPETKLVRFGARDYDSRIGRWLSKDPIRFEGGDTNLYGYVLNDPVNFTDPTGNVKVGQVIGGVILFLGGSAIVTGGITNPALGVVTKGGIYVAGGLVVAAGLTLIIDGLIEDANGASIKNESKISCNP